jgi:multiple sugar transport system substrate-binding protein
MIMSKNSSRTNLLLVTVLLLLALALVGPAGAQSSPVTIRVMTFFAYDNPEVEQAVVDAFEAANPDINVELELTSYNDIFTKYQVQLAGGTPPDVISMNFEQLSRFASRGALEPATAYVEASGLDLGIYYENTLDMHSVDGVLYGLPATFSNNVMFFNKSMFDAAGVDYPSADWDWDTLIEVGRQFVTDEDGDGIMDTYGYGPAWWPMYMFLYNTNLLTPDGSACALNTPEGLQAMSAYVSLFAEDGISPNTAAQQTQGTYDRFISGKLAMFVAGPWAVKPFNDSIEGFEWDIALHPAGTTEGTFLYSNSYAVSAGSANKDAAWKFIAFATGEEGARIRQEGQFEITALRSIAESTFVESMVGQSPAHPEVFMEAVQFGQRLPDHARFQEILDAIQPELDLALLGMQSVEDSMNNACDAINAILQEG